MNELVSAFDRLYRENPKIRLLLVGPFEEELDPVTPETRKMIENHPAIEAVGWQSDVRPFLAASDIFVFPSYREGFPNVVMQAGAMGLPSIATRINGCTEIIQPGINGVLIPSKDEEALYTMLKDTVDHPERWRNMALQSRESIASRYERKAFWKEMKALYASLE